MQTSTTPGDGNWTIITDIQFVNAHATVLTGIILYIDCAIFVLICAWLGQRLRWASLFALSIIIVPIVIRDVSNLGEADCLDTLCIDEQLAYRALFILIWFLETTLSLYRWEDQAPVSVDSSGAAAPAAARTVVTRRAFRMAVGIAAVWLAIHVGGVLWAHFSRSEMVAAIEIAVNGTVLVGILVIHTLPQIRRAMDRIGEAHCAQTRRRRRWLSYLTVIFCSASTIAETTANFVGAATSASSNATVEMLHRVAVIFILAATAFTAANHETQKRSRATLKSFHNGMDGDDDDDGDGALFEIVEHEPPALPPSDSDQRQNALGHEHRRVLSRREEEGGGGAPSPGELKEQPSSSATAVEMMPMSRPPITNTCMLESFLQFGIWWSPFSLLECKDLLSHRTERDGAPSDTTGLYKLLCELDKVDDSKPRKGRSRSLADHTQCQAVIQDIKKELRRFTFTGLSYIQNRLVTRAQERPDAAVQGLARVYVFFNAYCGQESHQDIQAFYDYFQGRVTGKMAPDGTDLVKNTAPAAGSTLQTILTQLNAMTQGAWPPVPLYRPEVYQKLLRVSQQSCYVGSREEVEQKFATPLARIEWLLKTHTDSKTAELKLQTGAVPPILACAGLAEALKVSDLLAASGSGVKTVTVQLAEALQHMWPYYQLEICSHYHAAVPIHALVSWFTQNQDAMSRIHSQAFKQASIPPLPPAPAPAEVKRSRPTTTQDQDVQDTTAAAADAATEEEQEQEQTSPGDATEEHHHLQLHEFKDSDDVDVAAAAQEDESVVDREHHESLIISSKTIVEARKWDNAMRHLLVICLLALRTSKHVPWMNTFIHQSVRQIRDLREKLLQLNDCYRKDSADFLLQFEVSSSPTLEKSPVAQSLLARVWTDFQTGLASLEASVTERVVEIQETRGADVYENAYTAITLDVSRKLAWLPMDTFVRTQLTDVFVKDVDACIAYPNGSADDRRSWMVFCILLFTAYCGECEYGIKMCTSLRRWLSTDLAAFLLRWSISAGADAAARKSLSPADRQSMQSMTHKCMAIPLHVSNPFKISA